MRAKLYLVPIKHAELHNWLGLPAFTRSGLVKVVGIVPGQDRISKVNIKIENNTIVQLDTREEVNLYKVVAYITDRNHDPDDRWLPFRISQYEDIQSNLPTFRGKVFKIGIIDEKRQVPFTHYPVKIRIDEQHGYRHAFRPY